MPARRREHLVWAARATLPRTDKTVRGRLVFTHYTRIGGVCTAQLTCIGPRDLAEGHSLAGGQARGDLSICARSGAPCALLAAHLVCVLVLANSMEAAAEEGEVPAELPRALFAHGVKQVRHSIAFWRRFGCTINHSTTA